MPFAVTTPAGHVVRLDDVPLSDLQKIVEEAGLDSWVLLVTEPARNATAVEALYRYCCEISGDKPPERITAKVIGEAVSFVTDDLPDTYRGGLPLAGDEPATSGSSGAPSDTTGPLP